MPRLWLADVGNMWAISFKILHLGRTASRAGITSKDEGRPGGSFRIALSCTFASFTEFHGMKPDYLSQTQFSLLDTFASRSTIRYLREQMNTRHDLLPRLG